MSDDRHGTAIGGVRSGFDTDGFITFYGYEDTENADTIAGSYGSHCVGFDVAAPIVMPPPCETIEPEPVADGVTILDWSEALEEFYARLRG